MSKKFFVIFFLIIGLNLQAQNYNYDLVYEGLYVKTDLKTRYVDAHTKIGISLKKPSKFITLDFTDSLSVDSVKDCNGKRMLFEHKHNFLNIFFSDSVVGYRCFTVYYRGDIPEKDSEAYNLQYIEHNVPVLWTLTEPYGAKFLFPTKNNLGDKIDSLGIELVVPKQYEVAANGVLVKDTVIGNYRHVRWESHYPIATYLVAFAVTKYRRIIDTVTIGNGLKVPIMNFLYFNAPYSLDARAEFANKCMKLNSKLWGIYPFAREKYGQAQIGWGGGMENQTMTFLGVFTQDVVAHELSHQWFGDYITCGSWHEIYLNEAFASYMEGLVARYGLTNYTFYDWLKRTRALALTDSCGSIYVRDTNDVDAIFDYVLVYEKGAYWLRMLRWVMGDSAFMAGIRSYLADSSLAYGFAHTSDLERHMEKACNCDLSYMFGPWLKGEGYPIYTVRFVSGKHGVVVHLKQKGSCSKSPVFKMKLEFLLQGRDTFARRIVWNYTRDTVYKFDEPFAVKYVILDPAQEVLSIVHYQDSTHQIYLYPQPARDFVYLLQIKPNYIKCKLYSSTGKYLKGCEYSGQVLRLNLRSLPAGTYRLGVKEGNGETLKFQIIKK